MINQPGTTIEISPLSVRRLKDAIESELAEKGFENATNAREADFVISFTVGARDKTDVDADPDYCGDTWQWNPPYCGCSVEIYTYTEGMLGIDIFDGQTREPVWHGWARKRITDADVRDPKPVIERVAKAILSSFPPN